MTTYTKIRAAPLLAAAKAAGITVRGFRGLWGTRGSGDDLEADHLERDGRPLRRVRVGTTCGSDAVTVSWKGEDEGSVDLYVRLSDDGDLEFGPEPARAAPAPSNPVWR